MKVRCYYCDDGDNATVSAERKQPFRPEVIHWSLKAKPVLYVSLYVLFASYNIVVVVLIEPNVEKLGNFAQKSWSVFFLIKGEDLSPIVSLMAISARAQERSPWQFPYLSHSLALTQSKSVCTRCLRHWLKWFL